MEPQAGAGKRDTLMGDRLIPCTSRLPRPGLSHALSHGLPQRLFLAGLMALAMPWAAQADPAMEQELQSVLDAVIADNPTIPGVLASFQSGTLALNWQGAAGFSDLPTQTAMKPDQPLRLASTTKTYVATAILRLMEQGKLALDDAIEGHLPREQREVLASGGYAPAAISIRHLLTHTSGLFDYAMTKAFMEAIRGDPQHRWSRIEQLPFAMTHGETYGAPGQIYHYSDTGYILLGEIIEQHSGLGLAEALRHLLAFDGLGLGATWLETLEPTPSTAGPRAHQYLGNDDTFDFDASFDLYGGGGLAASMPDLARFYGALFRGGIYEQATTLAVMQTGIVPVLGGPSAYRMGIVVGEYRGHTFFSHGGFWGTLGAYMPALDLAMGIAATQQESRKEQRKLLHALLDVILDAQ